MWVRAAVAIGLSIPAPSSLFQCSSIDSPTVSARVYS